MSAPLAIFTSDWHIWGRPTLYRSAEPDWFAAMDRPLKQIRRFQKRNHDIPVFVAGDIFDYYNPPPEVLNWMIKKMPKNVYAIPGQHDLQNHVYDLIEKTGFWTLVQAGVINFLAPDKCETVDSQGFILRVFSKPWQTKGLEPEREGVCDFVVYIAHEYIYSGAENKYNDAPTSANIKNAKELLEQVDVAVFGDNHIPFVTKVGKTKVINCGTLLRRKVDERDYEPGFTVLYEDGTIERIPFDTSRDQFAQIVITQKDGDKQDKLAAELLEELQNLDTISADFEQEIYRYLDKHKFPQKSKQTITDILNDYKEQKK